MRLNKQLSICVGIIFLMLTAIANVKGGNITEKLSGSESRLVKNSSYSYDLTSDEFRKLYSFEDFSMNLGISQGIKLKEYEAMFSHLNIQKIVNHDELFSSKESLADYSLRLNKIKHTHQCKNLRFRRYHSLRHQNLPHQ